MGIDYYAYVILGLPIDEDKLVTGHTETIKAFDHNYPEYMSYCPKTGKKLWEDKYIVENEIDLDDISEDIESVQDDDKIYAAIFLEYMNLKRDSGSILLEIPNIEEAKQKMRQYLEPLGLWNEEDFGLYLVGIVG